MALAKEFGITQYPMPAGGCLLTDKVFSERLRDLFDHQEIHANEELNLLKYGRHLRLDSTAKVVIGRNQKDNEQILSCYRPEKDILIKMKNFPGPVGMIPNGCSELILVRAASICAGYSKAPKDKPVEMCVTLPGGGLTITVNPTPHEEVKDFLIP
jgi:tRNA-uridine 2-sulfurtransferase